MGSLILGLPEYVCGRMAGRENAKTESKVKGEEGEMKQRWSYRRQALQHVER